MNTAQTLTKIPLFHTLTDTQYQQLARHARYLSIKRGEILFQKGDPSDGFYYVIQGKMKLAISAKNGNERVIEIIQTDMTFGEAVMFINKPYPVYAQAVVDSQLLFIAKQAILRAIEQDTQFALKMLAGLSYRLHSLVKDVESSCLYDSTQRIVIYLSMLEMNETGWIILPATKSVVASLLNLTPETFSRVLKILSEQQLITVKGRHIQIHDIKKLRQFSHTQPI